MFTQAGQLGLAFFVWPCGVVFCEQRRECFSIHRFDQVCIETSFVKALLLFLLSPPGEGHKHHTFTPRL